jgi:hypothetical protein
MKLPLPFRRKNGIQQRPSRDLLEERLAEGLRMLAQVCSKMAELLEAQRLSRKGFSAQGKFLERLDDDRR